MCVRVQIDGFLHFTDIILSTEEGAYHSCSNIMLACFCSCFDARTCSMVHSYETSRIKFFAFKSNLGCSDYSSADFIYCTWDGAWKTVFRLYKNVTLLYMTLCWTHVME